MWWRRAGRMSARLRTTSSRWPARSACSRTKRHGAATDTSLLFTLYYIACFGNESNPGTLERGIGQEGGAQDSRFYGGSQLVSIRAAEQLDGRVVRNAPVRRIDQDGTGATVYSDA